MGLGLLTPEISLLNFYLVHVDVRPAGSVSVSLQDGCGIFNSVVLRLPFNLISDGSECWFFYILVVILMRLCKEVSHDCLCQHLDWK